MGREWILLRFQGCPANRMPLSVRIVGMRQGTCLSRWSGTARADLRLAVSTSWTGRELAGSVNADKEIELSRCSLPLRNIDVEEPDRLAPEPLALWLVPCPAVHCKSMSRGGAPTTGNRDIPCRCRQRCYEDLGGCGIAGCVAWRQSSRGSNVCRRTATTIACQDSVRTVERGSLGPVFRSPAVTRFRHVATVFGSTPGSRLSAAIKACDRLNAAMTVCVVVALP